MKAKAGFLSALLAVFLGGCSVGPDYHPPTASVPGQWSESLAVGVTNRDESLGDWWKVFQDAELNSLIERAVRTNLDLRLAEARVREARARLGMAEAARWPTLDGAGSYNRERLSKNAFPPLPPYVQSPESGLYQAGFDATWEVDVFGGKRRAVEAGAADVAALDYGRRDVLVSVLAEVARNYVSTRGLQRQLAIAREQIQSQEETVSIMRSRVDHGAATDLDLQRALALLATLRSQIPPVENAIETSVHRLGVLLDQAPGAFRQELYAPRALPLAIPEVPIGLPSDLLRRRPDVRRAERQLAAETARIGQAKADLFPKFSLTGSAGLASTSASDFLYPNSRVWSLGPTVQWRIFDAGRVRDNIRAQSAVRDEASLTYEKAVLAALEDVENALAGYAKEREHEGWLEEAVIANQKSVAIASALYDNGLGNYLDLLDAQRTFYTSQDQWVQSELTLTLDLIALYKALGGGWDAGSRAGSGSKTGW